MKELKTEYLNCPIRHVIDRFGDKWSLLVLFALWRNETGVMRFSDLHRFMSDCSQKMLSQTLKRLEKNHLVHRKQYPEVPPISSRWSIGGWNTSMRSPTARSLFNDQRADYGNDQRADYENKQRTISDQ